MSSNKRPLADPDATPSSAEPAAKKPKTGFRLPGPANLPDGPWRRKVVKVKHELIVKSKIKKEYAKLKTQQQQHQQQQQTKSRDIVAVSAPDGVEDKADFETKQQGESHVAEAPAEPDIHPERQAMLDTDEQDLRDQAEDVNGFRSRNREVTDRRGRRGRKPGYFEKELAEAERKRAEAEARAAERERREKERERALKERERHRRIMAKARSGGRDGKRKLGKESIVLLDRVRRLVGEGK
jgi:hypothetical protein